MMRTVTVAAFGSLLLQAVTALAVSAQEPRLAGRLAEPARTQVDGMLDAARSERLPVEPLVDKALEGWAKNAPPALIVTAVRRLFDELRSARQAFGPAASDAELTAGASALRAGASRANLSKLRALRPRQPLTIPAGVLADLVAAGVAADTGIAAVLALASKAGDADYIAFRRNVERDIALGASPASSIAARLRAASPMADASMLQTGSGPPTTIKKRKP
jgi:hypothetical protein